VSIKAAGSKQESGNRQAVPVMIFIYSRSAVDGVKQKKGSAGRLT
jgi:hypothetical protein